MPETNYKSGFVSIIGRPNVGKSTLLNRLVGQVISITANKPQTTRNNIRGIITKDDYQAILLDTPGIHMPENELHKRIVHYAVSSISDTDLVFFITECLRFGEEKIPEKDLMVLEHFKSLNKNIVLLINKVDLSTEAQVLNTIKVYNSDFDFKEIVPVSALKGSGTNKIEAFFRKYLPQGIPYYDEDQMTDTPERVIIAEFVREQLMRMCFQEVPYGVAVVVEKFKEAPKKINIYCTIHTERESHKKIIIGKGGSMLKKVGENSRKKMELLLGNKVYLDLHVKVSKNWVNNPAKLTEFGYSIN